MLKMALFDSAISIDGGQGICPLFSSHPRGFDSSRVPTPGNLPSKAKNANARGSARGGGASPALTGFG